MGINSVIIPTRLVEAEPWEDIQADFESAILPGGNVIPYRELYCYGCHFLHSLEFYKSPIGKAQTSLHSTRRIRHFLQLLLICSVI